MSFFFQFIDDHPAVVVALVLIGLITCIGVIAFCSDQGQPHHYLITIEQHSAAP